MPNALPLRRRILRFPIIGPAIVGLQRFGYAAKVDVRFKRQVLRWLFTSREKTNITYALSPESVDHLAWTPAAVDLADVFWPGSVTIVLRDEIGRFPLGVRSPEGTVAVRMSPHPLIADLVNTLHAPLISTSVNVPGEPPALSASEAVDAVESLGLGEDLLILDGGRLDPSPASTIIDCSGDRPVMLREGTVPLERVRCVLPGVEADSDG